MVEVVYRKRTPMNFCMLFATLTASSVLVIRLRFTVKSVIGIYGKA